MAADMGEEAVRTVVGAAGLMEAEVASMVAAARMVAEDFRAEEALLAAGALAGAADRLAAGVPRDRVSAADHLAALSAAEHLVERNAVDNRAGHRRAGLAHLERVRAIRRRWAAGIRAELEAAAEATLELRVVRATEGLMGRGIRLGAEVAVLALPQVQADFTRLI
jgi:hypothetical protein